MPAQKNKIFTLFVNENIFGSSLAEKTKPMVRVQIPVLFIA